MTATIAIIVCSVCMLVVVVWTLAEFRAYKPTGPWDAWSEAFPAEVEDKPIDPTMHYARLLGREFATPERMSELQIDTAPMVYTLQRPMSDHIRVAGDAQPSTTPWVNLPPEPAKMFPHTRSTVEPWTPPEAA
jgi:hypothetical protein